MIINSIMCRHYSFTFRRAWSVALFFLVIATSSVVTNATTISIINGDGAGEGFNDTTATAAVTGNAGTTLGQQRLNVFYAAANFWEATLQSNVTINVEANMDPLDCDSSSAVLGSAGPETAHGNFANAPLNSTWYVAAVANSLANYDLDNSTSDISATFNSDIDNNNNCLASTNWWLGIGATAPSGTIGLYDTVLHEIGHGLGVLSMVDGSTGAKFGGYNDAYMYHINDETNGLWRDMSNAGRLASSTNTGNVTWHGTNADTHSCHVTAGTTNGHLRLFAPSPYQLGSSISHWDTTVTPDELMEPFATLTSDARSSVQLLKDVGWVLQDQPGQVAFSSSTYTGYEEDGSVLIEVTRESRDCPDALDVTGALNVKVVSSSGTADDYTDFNHVEQNLSWGSGETGTKSITVTLIQDGINEPGGETANFTLSINSGSDTLTTPSTATLNIEDKEDDGFCFPIKSSSNKVAVICL